MFNPKRNIDLLITDMIRMKVLIDTNILMYHEDDSVIQESQSNLFRLFNSIPVSVYIHPASLEDIRRDEDNKRQEIIFSKTKGYPHLPNPPDPFIDESFIRQVGPITSENDRVDVRILYALIKVIFSPFEIESVKVSVTGSPK